MKQIEVRVFRHGKEIKRILRPLRYVAGKRAVKYKRQFWQLLAGDEIHLDDIALADKLNSEPNAVKKQTEDAQEFQVAPPARIVWDQSQRRVIDAPPEDRLLIGAGPGTGKTAVACARVSQLIDRNGLEPSRIWLISFTRTAVREIRARIAAYLEDAAAAYAVKIATLDSHAWIIHSGFDEEAKILGTYEHNIERVLDLVHQNENVADYLENVEHLVVDEAQDIVGIRADLIVEIIRKLSSSCGVTVFADEAQSIYGFADDRVVQPGEVRAPPLPEKIRNGVASTFRACELTEVHRTHSPQLLMIFSDTRRKVLTTDAESENKLAEIRDEVIRLAHGEAPCVDNVALAELKDTFILYRRRCDVLLTSSLLTQNGIQHRLRMSGLPVCLTPWIGGALARHTDADLSLERFKELWADNVEDTSLATCEANDAWAHLVRIAGRSQTVVDMRLLRQRLGRKQPPAELCHAELGLRGPIVGTIHAAKGREADTVHLMLSNTHGRNVDQDEEARVVFVGATRGRSRLLIGRGYHQFAGRVEVSGRAYCLHTKDKKARAQVEIGHDNDIGPEGLAGRSYFTSPEIVRAAQNRIQRLADKTVSIVAEIDRDAGFIYKLKEDGQGQSLAILSQAVNADLFTIANAIRSKLGGGRRRPPDKIRHLHMRGVRTIVLQPDAPEAEALCEPWRSSGIMLAPLVIGYSTTFFPFASGRRS